MRQRLLAFARRDFRILRSYRAAMVGQIAGTLLFLASFAIVSSVVRDDFADRFGAGYAAYAAVGVAITGVLIAAMQAFADSVREAQLDGTLEAMLLAPARGEEIVACMGAFAVVVSVVTGTVTVGVAAIVTGDFDVDVVTLLLTFVLSVVAFCGVGLLSAAAVLLMKRGNPVATLLGMAGSLTAGAYAPVDTFPDWLRWLARVNPMTYAVEAWRAALLFGDGPGTVAGALAVLGGVAVLGLPFSWWVLGRAIHVARADGTLGSY